MPATNALATCPVTLLPFKLVRYCPLPMILPPELTLPVTFTLANVPTLVILGCAFV